MLLQATDIYVRYGLTPVLDHINFFIEEKQKIGVVGVNGQGKSTLLKVIASQDKAYGTFTKKPQMTISFLEQQPQFSNGQTIADLLMNVTSDNEHYRFKSLLGKFGMNDLSKTIQTLSGGQQKRIALALALSKEADLLILDEPTNHLDMDMILWLEKYLQHYKGAVLMVTHDRYFLDRITQTIVEISHGKLYTSHGGYQGYLDYASQRYDDVVAKKRKRDSILRRETLWVKAGVEARRTKSKERLARYEALLKEKGPEVSEQISMNMGMQRLGRKTITFDHVTKAFKNHLLFENFSYQVQPFDRIGILGDNGSGKTTLLNMLCGKDKDFDGEIIIGETIKFGYFDQMSMHLDSEMKAYDFIKNISDAITTTDGIVNAKTMMNQFLFDDDTMYLPIKRLSGGQKRRLYLLSILMAEPNVLIFDEPTNDLDVDTLTVLEDFLDTYEGIIITVSHDRYFLDKVVDKMFVFANQKIEIYNGCCSDYLDRLEKEVVVKKEITNKNFRKEPKVRLTFQEKKELESLSLRLPILEEELSQIEKAFENSNLSYDEIQQLTQKQSILEEELEVKTERWLELSEKQENSLK